MGQKDTSVIGEEFVAVQVWLVAEDIIHPHFVSTHLLYLSVSL
jgi:hypothetical protein